MSAFVARRLTPAPTFTSFLFSWTSFGKEKELEVPYKTPGEYRFFSNPRHPLYLTDQPIGISGSQKEPPCDFLP